MLVPFSVTDFIDRAVQVYGDRVGVVDEPDQPAPSLGELTYAQVGDLARRQAAQLDELGIGVGDRVAVVSHNSARLLTSFFGVSGYGRVLVPVNFRLRPDEVRYIVEHSGARVLLRRPGARRVVAGGRRPSTGSCWATTTTSTPPRDAEPKPWEPDENATATINYTSGTTARPKGVQITHRNIWVNAVTFALHAGVTDRDVYLHTLPMFHANGWGMPFAMTGMGVQHIVLRKVDGAEILRRVEKHGVTVMCAAPAVAAAVLEAAQTWEGEIPGRDRVRIIMAGAPPPTKTVARVEEELGWEFIQIYGLTETSPLLTVNRTRAEWDDLSAQERAEKLTRAGMPALGVRLKIEVPEEDEHGPARCWPAPTSCSRATGSSPRRASGRSRTAGSTPATAASIGEDGYLTISDRKKDVIITGGENVSSIEVEDVLFSHPAVAEVARDRRARREVGRDHQGPRRARRRRGRHRGRADRVVQGQARPGYKAPTSVEFRDELARTATGKLQKFKLRAPYWEGRERQVN